MLSQTNAHDFSCFSKLIFSEHYSVVRLNSNDFVAVALLQSTVWIRVGSLSSLSLLLVFKNSSVRKQRWCSHTHGQTFGERCFLHVLRVQLDKNDWWTSQAAEFFLFVTRKPTNDQVIQQLTRLRFLSLKTFTPKTFVNKFAKVCCVKFLQLATHKKQFHNNFISLVSSEDGR